MNHHESIRQHADEGPLRTSRNDVELMLAPPFTQTTTTTHLLHCIECHRPWLDATERWRLKVTDESPPETVPYCARCASREFGPAVPRKSA